MTKSRRRRFVRFTVFAVLLSYLAAAMFGPPDPIVQLRLAAGCVGVGIGVAYWLAYYTAITPAVRPVDVLRWFVSTIVFTFGIQLLGQLAFPTVDRIQSWPAESAINLFGSIIAAIVVWSNRIPWPGDR